MWVNDVGKSFTVNGFDVINNVYIDVIDTNTNALVKRVEKHNKATRKMIEGIIRFLCGHFTATNLNDSPLYSDAEQYIPLYFSVGDGGVVLDLNGNQQGTNRIPDLDTEWDAIVDYNSTKLVREFFVGRSARTRIRKVTTTVGQPESAGSMDSLYFQCEIGPGKMNEQYGGNPVFVTELGLFPTSVCGSEDLLAYVKLTNSDGGEDTDAIYVRKDDTIVVRWIISFVAVGQDSTFSAMMKDENGEYVERTLIATPNLGSFEVEEVQPNNEL